MEIFKLFGSIFVDNDQANQNIDETEKNANSLMGTFGKIAGVIAGAFAVDKIIEFGKTMLNTTADIQALDGQYSQVMGGMKADTDKYLDEMSNKWNKHPTELKQAYMQYVAILKSKGVEEGKAHELAKQYLDMTVDANAFANEGMADTVARFMGGIKGEYDSLDTAMVNLSATMMNDMAVKEYGKKFDELTTAEQETLKTQEMLRQHTSAGVFGQGGREADSYANNLAMIKNTWDELLAKFGAPVLEFANEKLKGIATFLKGVNVDSIMVGFSNFGNYISSVLGPIIEGVKSNFKEFIGFLENSGAMSGFESAAVGIKEGFQWVKDNLPNITGHIGEFIDKFDWLIAGVLGGLAAFQLMTGAVALWNNIVKIATAVQGAWNAIMAMSPMGWVAIGIGALIAVIILLWKNWDQVSKWLSASWQWIKDTAVLIFNSIVEFFKKWGLTILAVITGPIGWIVAFIVKNWDSIKQTTISAWNAVKNGILNVWDGIKSGIGSAIDGIKGFFTGLWDKATEIAGKIKSAFSNIFGSIKLPHFKLIGSLDPTKWIKQGLPKLDIDWYAKGTNYADGGLSVVGENGPEILNIPRGSQVKPAHETRQILEENESNYKQPVIFRFVTPDLRELAEIMVDDITEFQEFKLDRNKLIRGGS